MKPIKIRDIRVIQTAPRDINLVAVKIETTEPGLYGLGCATFTQRPNAVAVAVEEYLKPLLLGRDIANIEDIWQLCMVNAYWRNGPVLNNAVSGVDEALWDLKGKVAGMPVYDLLGGKCREGAAVYRHAAGDTFEELCAAIDGFMAEGVRYLRVQLGFYGGTGETIVKPENSPEGAYFNPKEYVREQVEMFKRLREKYGYSIELCHDVHERLTVNDAVCMARELEPYRLLFLEDALPPENIEAMKLLRSQTSTPLAIGELFNNPLEWKTIVANGEIDYIRVHVSQIGGLTPARKLAALCETFGVRTAWHGPGDITPIGVAAHLHLDLAVPNFGIQEFNGFSKEELEVFPGAPELRGGYLYANGKPGLGVELDEKAAAAYPPRFHTNRWTQSRLPDGTLVRP